MKYGIVILGWVLMIGSAAFAGSWSITTATFQEQAGDLAGVSADGVALQQGNARVQLPWDQVVVIQQHNVPTVTTSEPFFLYTRQGQKLAGKPLEMANDKLTWHSELLGNVSIPMEQVKGWSRTGVDLPESAGKEDLVLLTNRDELHGVVDTGEGGISVQGSAGNSTVRWENLRAVVLADVGSAPAAPALVRVKSADGSLYVADRVEVNQGKLQLTRQGKTSTLPLSAVVQVQNLASKVVFLAWLQPAELSYAPYMQFSSAQKPVGMRVLDEATVQEHTYLNVIELRPKTSLKYTAPADGKLHLQYACARAGDLTDMSVKVMVGQTVVKEEPSFRSSQPSSAIDAPVSKGDAVTIDVGYGSGFDAQDYLWLLDAGFVAR